MTYLFTSESVSEGHPDKVADQISDALIDNFLAFDKNSKVACETLVTTGQVILAGEVKSSIYLDVQKIARDTINKIGYTKSDYMFDGNSCGVFSSIHEQSRIASKRTKKFHSIVKLVCNFLFTNYCCNWMSITKRLSNCNYVRYDVMQFKAPKLFTNST